MSQFSTSTSTSTRTSRLRRPHLFGRAAALATLINLGAAPVIGTPVTTSHGSCGLDHH